MRLSQKAKAICHSYWWPLKTRCHNCPLHQKCTSWTQGKCSHEIINNWAIEMNAAADKIEFEPAIDLKIKCRTEGCTVHTFDPLATDG